MKMSYGRHNGRNQHHCTHSRLYLDRTEAYNEFCSASLIRDRTKLASRNDEFSTPTKRFGQKSGCPRRHNFERCHAIRNQEKIVICSLGLVQDVVSS
jgi:hypothetical protein